MHERRGVREARRAREFEAFVSGAGGRLLHTATLLTAEAPTDNPRAQELLTTALAHTYAAWDGLRGDDPYEHARQQLAVRFAHGAWRRHHGAGHLRPLRLDRHRLRSTVRRVLGRTTEPARSGAAPEAEDKPVRTGEAKDSGTGNAGPQRGRAADRSRGGPGDGSKARHPHGSWRARLRPPRPQGVLAGLTSQERLVLVLRLYEGVAEEQVGALLGLPVERVRAVGARAVSQLLHPPPARTRTVPKVVPS